MMPPTTILEAIEQLETVAKYYFEHTGWKTLPAIKREGDLGEGNEESDLHIEIDGWLNITPIHVKEPYPCIGRTRVRDAIRYELSKVVVIPGVHYRKDGSGEPDDVDIVPIKTDKPITYVGQAIEQVIHLLVQNELDSIGENLAEAEMDEDAEEMYNEWAKEIS